jgi:hypothetical protein
MPKKMGRPTSNPKIDRLTVRLDILTKTILDKYCEQENIKPTEAIRRGVKKLESDIKK